MHRGTSFRRGKLPVLTHEIRNGRGVLVFVFIIIGHAPLCVRHRSLNKGIGIIEKSRKLIMRKCPCPFSPFYICAFIQLSADNTAVPEGIYAEELCMQLFRAEYGDNALPCRLKAQPKGKERTYHPVEIAPCFEYPAVGERRGIFCKLPVHLLISSEHDEPFPRTRHADIEDTLFLLALPVILAQLYCAPYYRKASALAEGLEPEPHAELGIEYRRIAARARAESARNACKEDHGEFKPLALMHAHHAHRINGHLLRSALLAPFIHHIQHTDKAVQTVPLAALIEMRTVNQLHKVCLPHRAAREHAEEAVIIRFTYEPAYERLNARPPHEFAPDFDIRKQLPAFSSAAFFIRLRSRDNGIQKLRFLRPIRVFRPEQHRFTARQPDYRRAQHAHQGYILPPVIYDAEKIDKDLNLDGIVKALAQRSDAGNAAGGEGVDPAKRGSGRSAHEHGKIGIRTAAHAPELLIKDHGGIHYPPYLGSRSQRLRFGALIGLRLVLILFFLILAERNQHEFGASALGFSARTQRRAA